jgi:hypothetical protein
MEDRMKRPVMFVPVLLAVGLLAVTAQAKLKTGDRAKLSGFLATYTNPQLAGDDQEKGLRDFVDWFGQGGRSKELADVADIAELLAGSGVRPNQASGVRTREFLPFEDVKVTCVVSTPRKYSGSKDSDPWPLIYCLPDKGMKPEEFIDKYWPGAIRDTFVIAAVAIDYTEKEVENRKPVKDEDGRIRYENVKEKIPFSWDSVAMFDQFWGGLKSLLLLEYKINPNRVILDGAGIGASGVLYFASSQPWRFAGVVLRGGSLSGPSVANLAHMSVLLRPEKIADEAQMKAFAETRTALAGLLKEKLVDPAPAGADEAATLGNVTKWVTDTRRDRYPVPQTWVYEGVAQQWGYWFGILGLFNPEKQATVSLKADREKKRLDLETVNVSELRLFVNDILMDMDQPVDLYINGELVRKQVMVSRSALQVLGHAFEKSPIDPGVVFPGELSEILIAPPKAPDDGGKKEEAPKDKDGGKTEEAPKDKDGEKK